MISHQKEMHKKAELEKYRKGTDVLVMVVVMGLVVINVFLFWRMM